MHGFIGNCTSARRGEAVNDSDCRTRVNSDIACRRIRENSDGYGPIQNLTTSKGHNSFRFFFATDPLRRARLTCLAGFLLCIFGPLRIIQGTIRLDQATHEDSEQTEITAQFLKVLLAHPRFGTAFDRVREFHLDRGSIGQFEESLCAVAGLPLLEPAGGKLQVASLPVPDSTEPATASLVVGMLRLQHSESAAAVIALRRAAEQRADDPVVHWYLARALLMAGKSDDAVTAFARAIECRPLKADFIEICKELARTHQRAQNAAAAVATWQRLESEFPGDLRVREQIAATLADEGRWQDALSRFESLAKDTKDAEQRVQANLSASDLLIQLSRPEEAIRVLESQLSSLDADSWLFREIRHRIENVFRSRDDLAGLSDYYDVWIKSHPEDVDALGRLARVLSLMNQSAAATEVYARAIQLAPSNVVLRESLIAQLVRDKKPAEAIAQYELLAQYDSGNLDHIEDWGQLYLSRVDLPAEERRAKAAAVWEQLLADRENDPATLSRVAGLMRRAELTDRAFQLYQAAIQNAPDEPQYREYLGEYLHRLQRTDEALATWKAMAEDDRRTESNLVRLAEVLHSFGVFEPALASMREACSLEPEFSDRLLFSEMLVEAAERLPVDDPAESPGHERSNGLNGEEDSRPRWGQATGREPGPRDEMIAESLNQLTLAEGLAETPEEFRQVLNERIKTLIAGRQLEEQTKLLAEELQSPKPGFSEKPGFSLADRWRTLALYRDAAEKLPEATASALKVVELEPQSTAGWSILADLYERTGRLGDAADAMRKLASLDRRGVSDILKKIARLEVRLGRFEQALQAGRDVVRATPGNPEAYQFFADLCFEVGKPDDAMNALRQAVRVNPGDEASLRALARTLADEFHTAEAIELYWRAFEKVPDLENQTAIVVLLSKLYLRTNQFEKLIQRLDLRAREHNLPREMSRHIATAYRESGEFRKAREALERLLMDDRQNVSVLKELVSLAEREHNLAEAEGYQRQVVEITPVVAEQSKLVKQLENAGKTDEAYNLQVTIAKSRTGRPEILREIELLTAGDHMSIAEELCETLLAQSPDDWEAMFLLCEIFRKTGRTAESDELCRRIVRLDVAFDTPRGLAPGIRNTQSSQRERTDSSESIGDFLQGSVHSTFGDVLCSCCRSLVCGETPPSNEDLAFVFGQEFRSRHGLRPAAFLIDSLNDDSQLRVGVTSEFWRALDDFLQKTSGNASKALRLFAIDQRLQRETTDEERARIRPVAASVLADLLVNAPECLCAPWFSIPSNVLDRESMLLLIEKSLAQANSLTQCFGLLEFAIPLEDHELLHRILKRIQALASDEAPWFLEDARVSVLFAEDTRIMVVETCMDLLDLLNKNDPQGLLEFLSVCWTPFLRSNDSTNAAVGHEPMSFHEVLKGEFGIEEALILERCIASLARLDAIGDFQKWTVNRAADGSARTMFRLCLVKAQMAGQLDDASGALLQQIIAAETMPHLQGLRFLIAKSASESGLHDEALQLVDSLTSTEPAFLAAVERFALKLSLEHGPRDRAMLAADRLFGLPSGTDEQLELIPVFSKLGMLDKVAAIEARLGRGSETRQSILGRQLQMYIAQGKTDVAGEAAWELLELASDGSLFSGRRPGDDRDDGGERLQAIKALDSRRLHAHWRRRCHRRVEEGPKECL